MQPSDLRSRRKDGENEQYAGINLIFYIKCNKLYKCEKRCILA